MFKGRFGNFYLYKVWALIVVFGAILASFAGWFIISSEKLDSSFFMFIFLQIIYGIVLCIPSLILSEIFYKILSKTKLSNQKVFIYTLIISLLTTNLTYFMFFNNGNIEEYFYVFFISYSICLITGFFIFKQKPETLNFKPETK